MKKESKIFVWSGVGLVCLALLLGIPFSRARLARARIPVPNTPVAEPTSAIESRIQLPGLSEPANLPGIPRLARLETTIPDRPRVEILKYTVEAGDTAWSIGQKFGIQPETILWGNSWMSAEAGSLKIGTELNILPVDGVLHKVAEGDTWERIELLHGVKMEEIVNYLGNRFSLEPPYELQVGQKLIVPGGINPVVWQDPGPQVIPTLGRSSPGLYDGPLVYMGTGYYIWPIAAPIIITQDYWGAHPAIDLDTYYRQPIFAADSGTVIFSGWSQVGYGNLVIIDHGNGFWTYYAHNSFNLVSAGQGVFQGQQIAESGSTGNSTGDHLDFRVRVDGGSFLNPMDFLP